MPNYQVVLLRDYENMRFTFNHYVRASCPHDARKAVALKIFDCGATDLHIIGVRVMRPARTAHNYTSIYENNARFVA